jgi:hypothetical protein
MTPRQRIAFEAPCHRSVETISLQFAEFVSFKGERWSTILTLNK